MPLELVREEPRSLKPLKLALSELKACEKCGEERCGKYTIPRLTETPKGLVLSAGFVFFCPEKRGLGYGKKVIGGMQGILSEVARRSGMNVIHLPHTAPQNEPMHKIMKRFGYERIRDYVEFGLDEEAGTEEIPRAQFKKTFAPSATPVNLSPSEEEIVRKLIEKKAALKDADRQVREFLESGG